MPRRSNLQRHSNAVKLAQLSVAVPQVVAHRVARMALSGPTLSARDRKEFTGMVLEKQAAFAQAWLDVASEALRLQQQLFLSFFTGRTPSAQRALHSVIAKGIAPIHRKALSNSKRLARTRLR